MSPTNRILVTGAELEPARSTRAFALHRAACEWQLDRPILIRDEDDILSRDQIDVKPYEHQRKNLLTFCRLAPVALVADDVGLGKTISAGLILVELILRKKVRKALVVCPSILVTQWERELTDKFGLRVVTATGGEELREAVRIKQGVVVTTYDTVRGHFDALGQAGIQMLILDEAHRLRRLHGPGKQPKIATRIRDGLKQRWFKFVLLLTATPIQNRVWDLYSLIDILAVAKGHRHPLGTPQEFTKRYLKNKTALEIQPHRRAEFRVHVKRYITRTRRKDAKLPFPERVVDLRKAQASEVERELVRVLGRHLDQLDALQQISLAQALMSSPEALVAQLENTVPHAPHLAECLKVAREIVAEGRPSAKMLRLGVILKELRDAQPDAFRLVIFTQRKETQNAIGAFLEKQGISHGFIRGGSTAKNCATIERFKKEPPEAHVIVSTDAGAEGVNLQVANMVVNYDLPWNPMIMEQRIGRVQRLGSDHAVVTILNLVVEGSVEERVVARLTKKLQMIGDAVGEIDAILESASAKGDDMGTSFQQVIRKLVVGSLQGKDMEAAVRLEEDSIDKAKRLWDKNQAVIEAQLGKLDELHTSGPTTPDLPVPEPAMSLADFVLGALEEDGAVVTKSDSGLLDVVLARGRRFQAVVGAEEADERLPSGVTRYAPGEPAFEALVDRWATREAALVYDRRSATDEALHVIAARWCEQIPGAVLRDVRQLGTRAAFQGEVDCAARAGVAHDGYEVLVSVDLCPDGHAKIPYDLPDNALLDDRARVESLFEGTNQAVERAVEGDLSIGKFCRFYDERREEELARVERGSDAEKYVQDSFTPTVHARIAGLRGYRYDVVRLHLTIQVDNKAHYEAGIEVIPPTSQTLSEPDLGSCEQSGRRVPVSWLETCCESKKRVLGHLLQQSERSGKRALPECFVRSALTNKELLTSEMVRSAVSGALAEPELLEASEMSQRKGLPSEITQCDFKGTKVLIDELVRSQISDRLLRKDQQAASAVSGVVGHESEFVKCEVSGADVLPEERERSDMSGHMVRRDWIIRSEKPPHRAGARTETVKCAHTGKRLLRDEVAKSDASGKLVDASLLVKSEASALRALPHDLVVCTLSQKRVLQIETETCVVTGRRARRDLMVRSVATSSTSYMLPGSEVRSALSNAPMAPNEAYTCPWLGVRVLPQETATCKRTGLTVAKRTLNANGELDALRRVLDDPSQGENAPDVVEWLSRIRFFTFRVPKWAVAISSPSGNLRAVAVRAERWFSRTDIGMIVARSPRDGTLTREGAYTTGT